MEQWDEEAIQNEILFLKNSEEINDLLEKMNNTYGRSGGLSDSIEELKTFSNDFLSHIHNFLTLNDRIKSIKIRNRRYSFMKSIEILRLHYLIKIN